MLSSLTTIAIHGSDLKGTQHDSLLMPYMEGSAENHLMWSKVGESVLWPYIH